MDTTKILSSIGILVGALSVVFNLLAAFGVPVSAEQQKAIGDIAGVALTVLSVWFHPSIPVGKTSAQ